MIDKIFVDGEAHEILPKVKSNSGIAVDSTGIFLDNTVVKTSALQTKQDKLVSGVNIKTINGETLVGNGNIVVNSSFDLSGKVISILGDSISTFSGYIPTADGWNEEHPAAYPGQDVKQYTQTWWGRIIEATGAKLGINDSWSGSRVHNTYADANPGGNVGSKVCMSSVTRTFNLGSNGTPDVIFVYGGTNDGKFSTFKTFDSTVVYSTPNLENITWESFEDSYVEMILRLQYYYPTARIITLTPMYVANWYDNARCNLMAKHIQDISDYFGITCIDLRKCGITMQNYSKYMNDGLHPNAAGHQLMADYILTQLSTCLKLNKDINIVYKVTNDLTTLSTSYPQIKGVSKGTVYKATLTGSSNFSGVKIYMGSVDITSSALSSEGVITITNVSGDIVITDGEYVPPTDIPITGLNIVGQNSYTITVGNAQQLQVSYEPNNTTQTGINWSSSTPSIASVSSTGLVTAVSAGSTTITATSTSNSQISVTWTVTVVIEATPEEPNIPDESSVTWYVDNTDIEPNFSLPMVSQPGFALRSEEDVNAIRNVPINIVKVYIIGDGNFTLARGIKSDPTGATAIQTFEVNGAASLDAAKVDGPKTLVLSDSIILADDEYLIFGRGSGTTQTDKVSIGVSTAAKTNPVSVGWTAAHGVKDEAWSGPVAIGYINS